MKQRINSFLPTSPFCRVASLWSLLTLLLVQTVAQAHAELKDFGPAPSFTLTDTRGQEFNTDSLKGKIWIANFFFARCQGPCPIQATYLKKISEQFPGAEPQILSITADAENDTPEVLAEYAESLKADLSRWHFLTGDKQVILGLMNEQGFALGSAEQPVNHSTRFVLVDRDGRMRGFFRGTEAEEITKLSAAIKSLQ